jgi:hypothetical protein
MRGIAPWWSAADFRTDFLRPLSGLLFWLDETLWPGGGPFAHLHSLLWWLLLLLLLGALLRRLLPVRVAALALLIFAVDDAHWMSIAWLSNRHAAVATAAVLAGILCHLRWRDDGARGGVLLSLGCYAAGLAAGEAALQALAYLYSDELFGSGRGSLRARVARLLPASALVLTYGAVRHPLGAGVTGSGIYHDPLAQPLRFLAAAPGRLGVLLADLLGGMPSDLWMALPKLEPILIALGVAVTALVGWLALRVLTPPSERGPLVGLCVGGFLALILGSAGLPGSRLLLAPSLATAALFATLLSSATTPRAARIWIIAVHLVLAPLFLLVNEAQAITIGRRARQAIAASALDGDVVVVTTPDPLVALYTPYMEAERGAPRFNNWQVLSFAPVDLELKRAGADELVLRTQEGRFFEAPEERLLRDGPVPPGERIEQPGLVARVISPTEIDFRFTRPLESVNLVTWRDGALRHLPLPRPGGRVTIRREAGMMGY